MNKYTFRVYATYDVQVSADNYIEALYTAEKEAYDKSLQDGSEIQSINMTDVETNVDDDE